MKNFYTPVKCETFKFVTLVWNPQVESVAVMCKEHYDTKEYKDVVIFINCYYDDEKRLFNPIYFPQSRKIFYNLEHKHDKEKDDNLISYLKFMQIDEIWSIEPHISLLSDNFLIKYMPLRYYHVKNDIYQTNPKFDFGFVGVINKCSPHRIKFFTDYAFNYSMDFSINIINGISITDAKEELANCKFILDLKRQGIQQYQNQVRLMEHICLGHTVLSEKCNNNIFPDLIYEWENYEDLTNLMHTVEPNDFSEKYKAMTYRDDDYENYRNEMIKTY